MSLPLAGHVFVSYSHQNEAVMKRIVAFLRSQKINVWMDEKLTPGTAAWAEEIEKAIAGSVAVVVLLSPHSKKSTWVRREISYAAVYQKFIIPILVAGDGIQSIPIELATHQYLDLRTYESEGLNLLSHTILSGASELPIVDSPPTTDLKTTITANIQRIYKFIKAILPPRAQVLRLGYFSFGIAAVALFSAFFWTQLVYVASSPVDEQETLPMSQKIQINENVNYEASNLFLKGMILDIDVRTAVSLKDVPCELIVFFQRENGDYLTMPRSLANLVSPYISDQNYISVYKNLTPKYYYSKFNIELFVPYAALQSSELPAGKTQITYFASLYRRDDYSLLGQSAPAFFTYTK